MQVKVTPLTKYEEFIDHHLAHSLVMQNDSRTHCYTKSFNTVFKAGLAKAKYEVELTMEQYEHVKRLGIGLGDLMYSRFTDDQDAPLQYGDTVAISIAHMQHRAYVVIMPKTNFVIYDRFAPTGDKTILIGKWHHQGIVKLLGFNPSWVNGNQIDLGYAASVFGFEMHRSRGQVILSTLKNDPTRFNIPTAFDLLLQYSADVIAQ